MPFVDCRLKSHLTFDENNYIFGLKSVFLLEKYFLQKSPKKLGRPLKQLTDSKKNVFLIYQR